MLRALAAVLAVSMSLAAPAARGFVANWISASDPNMASAANWSGGNACLALDGIGHLTDDATQHHLVANPQSCVTNGLLFGGTLPWIVDGPHGVQFTSPLPTTSNPFLQADVDVTINTFLGFNSFSFAPPGGMSFAGAGNIAINGEVSGFVPLTVSGPGNVTIAAFNPDTFQFPIIVNGGTLTASPTTGQNALTINVSGSVVTTNATWGALSGSGALTINGTTTLAAASTFAGDIGGTGALVKSGPGTLTLTGDNSWSGGTTIGSGTLQFGDGVSGTFPRGNVSNFGTIVIDVPIPVIATIDSISGDGNVTIQAGGVAGTTSWNLGNGALTINGGAANTPAVVTNGRATVNAPGQWGMGNAFVGSLAGDGTLGLLLPVTFGADNSDSAFSGTITGSQPMAKIGSGTQTFGNIASTGTITISSGAIALNASTVAAPITAHAGTLRGTGTVLQAVTINGGGTIRSAVPGSLTTGILNAAGTVHVQIDGTTPAVTYGKLFVNGSVTLNSATLQLSGSYTPVIGDAFTIIDNDGSDAVTGTFAGLPTGGTIFLNGIPLRVSYAGGSNGNDVTLTVGTHIVTPSAGANGSISPNTAQTVIEGQTTSLTVTPATNYHIDTVSGCGGSLAGNTFTTAAITGDCTVTATFAIDQHTVSASAGANGSISPASKQVVHGSTTTFTVTPNAGYTASVGGTCPAGSLVGTTYTTGAITGPCSVTANFVALVVYNLVLEGWQQVAPYVITPASGGGTATFNPVSKQLALNLTYSGLSSAESMAHVHGPALRGANAGILHTLANGSPKTDVVTLDPTQEGQLAAGQLYVNIHTATHGNGEIRGQIDAVGATTLRTLTVNKAGDGTVTGTTEAGTVVACGSDCGETVPHGKVVALTATPTPPSQFVGWSGSGCSGTGTCLVTMDAAKTVTATFLSPGSDLGTTLAANPTLANLGEDVTFTLVVSNAGPEAGDGVASWATIPAGMTFVTAGAGCTQSTLGPASIVLCPPGNLAVGATATYTFVLRPTTVGTLTVSADVSSSKQDQVAGNNQSSAQVTVANNPPRLGNVSTRMQVLTGNDVLIGGFVIGGSTTKRVAIVATGPSLAAFGITNPLANPTLRLVRSSDQAVLVSNDDWQSASNQADLMAAGFAPSNALEAAILADLQPGAYTAIVEGAGGGTGVSVIGVYEIDHPETPLINISTRGRVLTGNDVMIGGFVINGTGPQTLAVVATGPSLAPFGITNPLANPKITLVRSSDQAVMATNDDWQADANSAQLQAAGFAPSNPLEAGLHVTLPPGAYTVIVEGVGGGTGVAVIGVYKVNQAGHEGR